MLPSKTTLVVTKRIVLQHPKIVQLRIKARRGILQLYPLLIRKITLVAKESITKLLTQVRTHQLLTNRIKQTRRHKTRLRITVLIRAQQFRT